MAHVVKTGEDDVLAVGLEGRLPAAVVLCEDAPDAAIRADQRDACLIEARARWSGYETARPPRHRVHDPAAIRGPVGVAAAFDDVPHV